MTLGVRDLQSDSDLDSNRNCHDVFQYNYTFTLYYFKVLLLVLPSVIEHKEYEIISAPTLQSFLVKCVLDFVADCCYHISSEDLEGHEEPGK